MASLEKKPEVFVVASAIGIYGDRGDEDIDENSTHGTGFLTIQQQYGIICGCCQRGRN